MSFYDEVQMQVTKTVQNIPPLRRHRYKVVKTAVDRVNILLELWTEAQRSLFLTHSVVSYYS